MTTIIWLLAIIIVAAAYTWIQTSSPPAKISSYRAQLLICAVISLIMTISLMVVQWQRLSAFFFTVAAISWMLASWEDDDGGSKQKVVDDLPSSDIDPDHSAPRRKQKA